MHVNLTLAVIIFVVILVMIGSVVYFLYQLTPDKVDGFTEQEQALLDELSRGQRDYVCVLLSLSFLGVHGGPYLKYAITRIAVVLKHADSQKDELLYRGNENPNEDSLNAEIEAFSHWLEAARSHDVPAVYQWYPLPLPWMEGVPMGRKIRRAVGMFTPRLDVDRELGVLSSSYIQLMREDPPGFFERFREHLHFGVPLPEGRTINE